MKTKLKKVQYLLVLFMVISSCKNNEPQEPSLTPANTSAHSREGLARQLKAIEAVPLDPRVSFDRNPYDHVGALHNLGLESLVSYIRSKKDTTRIGKSRFLHEYFKREYSVELQEGYDLALETKIFKDYRSVYRELSLSPASLTFLDAISDQIEAIKTLDGFATFKEGIQVIEEKILLAKIPENEKSALLVTASVMRHSAYYWFNFVNSDEKMETMGLLRKIAGVITGIAADGTSALYYMFTRADIFAVLDDAIGMSEICGFYTGGFSYW
ncbi:MAG TPA: hypothetical protein VN040_14915 [Pseudosphingobacterium sp.]|nr:hypothetical protein [Pseudosphingobacterium sp.]